MHLREDRRHIQDRDVIALKNIVRGKYNLEMALSDEIIAIAKKVRPDQVTLVPEKREEITTEGGLDVAAHFDRIRSVVTQFHDIGIIVSLFIEPEKDVVMRSKETGADYIEIHTGAYCNAADSRGWEPSPEMPPDVKRELGRILRAAERAGSPSRFFQRRPSHGVAVGPVWVSNKAGLLISMTALPPGSMKAIRWSDHGSHLLALFRHERPA